MTNKIFILILICLFASGARAQSDKIIYLGWENVVSSALENNLSLKTKALDYEIQEYEQWRAVTSFLPSLTYQGLAIRNLELPVFVFMGQRFVVGANYSFQHTLDLTLPLFTGGLRWFNLNAQKSIRRSLSEELKGMESETVLAALSSYYSVMLANDLLKTVNDAVKVAAGNLEQVEKFYNAGTATELDLQRAKAQYYSTLPQQQQAASARLMSYQRLKTLLNIPLEDSVVVTDSLYTRNFLEDIKNYGLNELKETASENRNDLKSLLHLKEAAGEGEKIALARFAPTISMSANLTHQAQMDDAKLEWKDYIRSKSIALSVYWPLFDGGQKIVDYQIAKIKSDQMSTAAAQAEDGAELDVEEKYYAFKEAEKNLESLKQAMEQSNESLRISTLMYNNGISTQLDVLNAQLLYTKSRSDYLQGIFNYNITQLQILNAVGLMNKIWK